MLTDMSCLQLNRSAFWLTVLTATFLQSASGQDFQTGQDADGVVGKVNFTTDLPDTPTATNLVGPAAVWVDSASGKFFVCDTAANRVLRYASAESALAGDPAEFAFGQPDLTSGDANNGGGVSATSLASPFAITVDRNGSLWVSDGANHRVLRYDLATEESPDLATRTADGVLGQVDFVSSAPALPSATTMFSPYGIWVEPNGAVWVCDAGNSRILRFNAVAAQTNGGAASIVLGQAVFDENSSGTSQFKIDTPFGVAMDSAGRLWVVDSINNRVLRFDNASAIGSNGVGASGVLGQPNFISGNSAVTASGMSTPFGVAVSPNGRLFVSENDSNRVTWFDDAAGLAIGSPANGVVGQTDFVTDGFGLSASQLTLPATPFLDASGRLWVPDFINRRVLRFSPVAAPTPIPTPTPQPTPTPEPERPTLKAKGKTKISTDKKRIVLRGQAFDSTKVRYKTGKGRFKKVKGASRRWKIRVRLKSPKTIVRVQATGPGGTSKPIRYIIRRR